MHFKTISLTHLILFPGLQPPLSSPPSALSPPAAKRYKALVATYILSWGLVFIEINFAHSPSG